jgi:hypothetical protein
MTAEKKAQQIAEARSFAHFDEMCWPLPNPGLEWRLRYGKPTREDILVAASILNAYQSLVCRKTPKQTRHIISTIRALGKD